MGIVERLYELYWAARGIIAPGLRYSQFHYEELLRRQVAPETAWLDLGCGRRVLSPWRAAEEPSLTRTGRITVGLDYDLPSLQDHHTISLKVRGSITDLPFADESFDLVTANMVVEHLETPHVQFDEVSRVLKPGGTFMFHTPNARGYSTILSMLTPEVLKKRLIYLLEERRPEDVFPTHYRANTLGRITALAQETGFDVATVHLLATDAAFALVLPLAIPELIWIRLLMTHPLRSLRPNIVAMLTKRAGTTNGARTTAIRAPLLQHVASPLP